MQKIGGKTINEWKRSYPILKDIISKEKVFWTNPNLVSQARLKNLNLSERDVKDAELRLARFAPYIREVFPETQKDNGMIESPLYDIPSMQQALEDFFGSELNAKMILKCDNYLPISGSIKARGGIYEVLKHAEELAISNGMLKEEDDYSVFNSKKFRDLFSKDSIAVGSTGNLGLSIGIMGAKLGFNVYVHVSQDAQTWKKDLLRSKGVSVIEYKDDYSKAVEAGRKQAEKDDKLYFIDDENSISLFLGYAVAAYRLKNQLDNMGIQVDKNNPLFVYLPCGVGGGPGGISFGLKLLFGDNVHCFFAEPTSSPSVLIGLLTGLHEKVSVQDFGLDNKTVADGLAVGRPSGLVGSTLDQQINGSYTVDDETLYKLLALLIDTENISLEPSAVAGFPGPFQLFNTGEGQKYITKLKLTRITGNITHLVWATGGNLLPASVKAEYYHKGKELLV